MKTNTYNSTPLCIIWILRFRVACFHSSKITLGWVIILIRELFIKYNKQFTGWQYKLYWKGLPHLQALTSGFWPLRVLLSVSKETKKGQQQGQGSTGENRCLWSFKWDIVDTRKVKTISFQLKSLGTNWNRICTATPEFAYHIYHWLSPSAHDSDFIQILSLKRNDKQQN